ncbi:hypothetical protein T492DRAFT_63475 [Pavlovales sp. CCMP2436]|nr:hypothetical protein T492DRAFT_63475 [Pavlovales sp. CCMP2436]
MIIFIMGSANERPFNGWRLLASKSLRQAQRQQPLFFFFFKGSKLWRSIARRKMDKLRRLASSSVRQI